MLRHRTTADIQRYDLMKLGVLLLLLALLFLTWYATRNDGALVDLETSQPGDGVVDPGDAVSVPAPTLAAPAIATPAGVVAPGVVTLSGVAGPGARVAVSANGQRVGMTTAGVDGNWALSAELPAGEYVIVAQTLDNTGAVVAESPPTALAVGEAVGSALSLEAQVTLDAARGVWEMGGTTAPGQTVTVLSNGAVVGATTTDETGAWRLEAPAVAVTGPVVVRFTDAAGTLLSETQPIATDSQIDTSGATSEAPTDGPTDSIAGLLAGRSELSTLWAAVQAAGLAGPLQGPAAFTLFAPDNDAFAALPQSVVDGLLANPQALSAVLQYHAAPGRYTATDLLTVQPSTANGGLLVIAPQGDGLTVNGATVIEADVAAGTSIVHIIDHVLLPPLAPAVRPPVIDEGGVTTFVGPALTVVGAGEPGRTILVELNGEPFGAPVVVDAAARWAVSGEVTPGEYRVIAYMLNGTTLEAVSRPVDLTAQ